MDPLMGFENTKIPVLVGTAIVVVGLTVYALRQPKDKPQYRKLEQPDTTLPILGNLLDVARRVDDFHDWILENTVRFEGRPWKFSLPGDGDIIIVTSPEAVKEVLSTQFTNFIKGRLQNEVLGGIAPDTVVTSDGERWYHQRKTTAKFFSARVLDLFVQRSIQKNIIRIHSLIEDAMRDQTTVDLKVLFHDFTLDTFIEMGLGIDLKSIGSTTKHPIHEAMELSSLAVYYRARRPEWWWKLERFLNVGWEAQLKSSVDALYACIHEIIKESVDRMVEKKQSGEDTTDQTCKSIVELFLESPQAGADGLTQDDFVGFVTALLFASRDTTADTLIWLFYLLHKHPEAEKKLREEMDRELAAFPRDNATCLNMEQLKPLVYLEAVIKETLRLYPAGAVTGREAAEDTVICGDILIRKGQDVTTPQYSISRSPAVWGPDAAEFRPERWIDESTGKIKPVPPYKFYTFSAGPRICPGMNLAMMELRVLTANLLRRYHFEVVGSIDGTYTARITIGLKDPLIVKPIAIPV